MLKKISFYDAIQIASQGVEGAFISMPVRIGSMVMDDLVKLDREGAVCLLIEPDEDEESIF